MSARLGATPTADVLDIEDAVKQVLAGRIRVPEFQRPLRWGQTDALRLFDSIVKGYPIGSLLLWQRAAHADTLRVGALTIDAPALQSAYWWVDGQQRVTTLANALTVGGAGDDRFALDLTLPDGEIVPHGSSRGVTIPLPVLFDLHQLLAWSRRNPEADEYFDLATDVAKRIRQYKIPVSIVESEDEEVLRDIFDRLNSYGKRLTRAEVFTALSPGGTRNEVDLIADHLATDLGFGRVDGNTIVQAMLARRGSDVMREIRGEFDSDRRVGSEFADEDVSAAYKGAERALELAVQFLQRDASVPHVGFLPYKYLLVVLARVFAHHYVLRERERELLRRWFWCAAAAGPSLYPGASTGTVRALAALVKPADLGATLSGLLAAVPRTKVEYPDVGEFRTNYGPGKIVACALWSLRPRSPETGDEFDRTELSEVLGESQTPRAAMVTMYSKRDVAQKWSDSAARWLICPGIDAADLLTLLSAGSILVDETERARVLASHAMTASADLLARGAFDEFASARTEEVDTLVHQFLDVQWAYGFEDTLPIDRYVVDDLIDED